MFFEKPTQVKFWDADNERWVGAIGYRDEVICGCCGGVFEVDDLMGDPIVKLPWVDISEEICGGE